MSSDDGGGLLSGLFGTRWCGTGGPSGEGSLWTFKGIDRACMRHDQCYDDHNLSNGDNYKVLQPGRREVLQRCNQALCDAMTTIINTSRDPYTGEPLVNSEKNGAGRVRWYFSNFGVATCSK